MTGDENETPTRSDPSDTPEPPPGAPVGETPKPTASASDRPEITLLAKIAGGTAIVVGVLAFFGIQGEALDAVVRNNAGVTFVAFALVFSGVVVSTIMVAFSGRWGLWAVLGGVVAAVLFFAGLGLAVKLSVESKAAKQRPYVNLSAAPADDGGMRVTFVAKASGLTNKESLTIELEGLHSTMPVYGQIIGRIGSRDDHSEAAESKRNSLDFTEEYVSRLSYVFVGPDENGAVAYTGTVDIPSGVYERVRLTGSVFENLRDEATQSGPMQRCAREASRRGCVALALPPAPVRPQLVATWSKRSTGEITATVATSSLRPTQGVIVEAAQEGTGAPATTLGQSFLTPDAAGSVEGSTVFVASEPNRPVCVRARLVDIEAEDATASSPAMPHVPEQGTQGGASQGAPPANAGGATASAEGPTAPADSGAQGGPDVPRACGTASTNEASVQLAGRG